MQSVLFVVPVCDVIEFETSDCRLMSFIALCSLDCLLFIISLTKEVMFLAVFGSVCLFVCLSVCEQHYSKSYERIVMKFYEGAQGGTMKNWLAIWTFLDE